MKFLVDAHLPSSLCALLASHGHDVVHTRDLAAGNETKDRIINSISLSEERVVISKDRDFFYSHMLQQRPWKLLIVTTGNISSRELIAIFSRNLVEIEAALSRCTLVEIDRAAVKSLT